MARSARFTRLMICFRLSSETVRDSPCLEARGDRFARYALHGGFPARCPVKTDHACFDRRLIGLADPIALRCAADQGVPILTCAAAKVIVSVPIRCLKDVRPTA